MYKGIDVSSNNGVLDWDAIKADGIEFAIIRVGYGSDESEQDDNQAVRNMQECERLGIPYGVYLYSYALEDSQAISEASHALRMIDGHKPQLGVWFDMEDADGYKERHGINVYESRQLLTDFCRTFCDIINATGNTSGIYANLNYFNNVLLTDQLSSYDKWLAIWGPDEVPEGNWKMWQYTSDGVVNGSNARTDMNYFYGELPQISKPVEELQPEYENEPTIEPQEHTQGLIEQVQLFLNNTFGFGLDEDNICGAFTKDALIKAYQIAMNNTYDTSLEVDGIFGQQSKNAANNLLSIRISNDVVKVLQASLQVQGYDMKGIDGIFGDITNSAVLDFQANHGLKVDGLVGLNTWAELFN